jgi:methionyl-tRNA formyltransferase
MGCVNVHASLLPKYRGAAPINWAIANGERETGVTIMQMDAGMDTGDMLLSRALEIGSEEIAPELSARLSELGAELLSEALPRIERGEIRPAPQDDGEATYAPMLRREDGLIDWRMSAGRIANRVRAFQPWPGTYTFFRGGRLTLWRAQETTADQCNQSSQYNVEHNVEPGSILAIDKSRMVIACADSTALGIEELQIEGKRKLTAREFLNGMRLGIGDRITESSEQ